jgi:hypothetical protein
MSGHERTGWRDEAFSARHREYGHNVPMLDVDFLCCEYNHFKPRAIVDYKSASGVCPPFFTGRVPPVLWPLVHLADAAEIPAFVVQYWTAADFACRPHALNSYAISVLPACRHIGGVVSMTETQWVATLYDLRGDTQMAAQVRKDRSIPTRLGNKLILGTTLPPTG